MAEKDTGTGEPGGRPAVPGIALWMPIGLALGISLGQLSGNVGMGIGLGMALGAGLGAGIDAAQRRKRDAADGS